MITDPSENYRFFSTVSLEQDSQQRWGTDYVRKCCLVARFIVLELAEAQSFML